MDDVRLGVLAVATGAVLAACKAPRGSPSSEATPANTGAAVAPTTFSLADAEPGPFEPPLRLATGSGYPPFADRHLPAGGLATELVESALGRAGIAYSLDWVPWNRAETLAADTRFDAIFPYMKTEARQERFLYSAPLFTVEARFFVRRSSAATLRNRYEVGGLTLCKPLGYAVEDALRAPLASRFMLLETPQDMQACLRMLKAGRVDAIVDAEHTFWPAAEAVLPEARQLFEMRGYVVQKTTLHLIAAKRNPRGVQLIAAFNESLAELRLERRRQERQKSRSANAAAP